MEPAPQKIASQLTGKGGAGLVMFHLARLGIEFVETTKDSHCADLWLRLPDGKFLTAEVKSAYGAQWPLKRHQIQAADVFFFVRMDTGRVFIADRQQVTDILVKGKQTGSLLSITQTQLTSAAEMRWASIGGAEPIQVAMPTTLTARKPAKRYARTVRRRLADGSVREYTYEASP